MSQHRGTLARDRERQPHFKRQEGEAQVLSWVWNDQASMKRTPSLVLALLNVLGIALVVIGLTAFVARATLEDVVPSDSRRVAAVVLGIELLAVLMLVGLPLMVLGLGGRDYARGFRRSSLCAIAVACAVLLVPVFWLAGGRRLAAYHERRVDRAWARDFESMEQFASRYSDATISIGALRLEAAAARLGVETNPTSPKGAHPLEEDRKAFQAIEPSLRAHVSPPDETSGAEPGPPPADVAAWLTAHREDVDILVKEASEGDPISFETNWSGAVQPLPSVWGLRGGSSAATLLALERGRAGDTAGALRALDAAWRIGGALRERGEFISQIGVHAIDGATLRALRHVHGAAPDWPSRLAQRDYRRSLLRTLQGEALQHAGLTRRLDAPVQGPFFRLMATDYSDALRVAAGQLNRANPCLLDMDAIDASAQASLVPWNVLGRETLPSLPRGWRSAVRVDLEVELTQKVLAARELRSPQGAWPATLADLESRVCPGLRWRYSASGGGAAAIVFDPGGQVGPPIAFKAGKH